MTAIRVIAAAVCALALGIIAGDVAMADVGEIAICNERVGFSTHSQSVGSTVEGAQIFTPTTTFTASGVKLPIYEFTTANLTGDTIGVRITETVDVSGTFRPDGGAVLASGTVAGEVIPLVVNPGTAAIQDLDCEADSGAGTVFEFDTPVVLSAGTAYAILMGDNSTDSVRWGVVIHNAPDYDNYDPGNFQNNTASQSSLIPSEWVDWCSLCDGADSDSGFAVYSNITPEPTGTNVNSWITTFLCVAGICDTTGKILFFGIALMGIFFSMVMKGVSSIVGMAIVWLGLLTLVESNFLPPGILFTALFVFGITYVLSLAMGRNQAQ